MSVFTPAELEYLKSQRLGRLATVNPKGEPQNSPVAFRYNPEFDAIEIGGRFMSQSKKYRNVLTNNHVAFVVDDVIPQPRKVRGVEIRGIAETAPEGGKAIFGDDYDADQTIIRIYPTQIIGWGIETDSYQANNRKVTVKK
jgi:pyridoxamine 5'-phosphate oxidase family protein